MRRRYVPRRGSYRGAAPPAAAVYEEVVEEHPADPYATPPRAEVAPWARNVWFWLLLLGIVVVLGVAILLAATLEDEARRKTLAPLG